MRVKSGTATVGVTMSGLPERMREKLLVYIHAMRWRPHVHI